MKRHLPWVVPILLAAATVPVTLAWSADVHAQQTPGLADEVRLKDGSVFRGTITELVPKDHIDLLMANGQTRRFPAADVAYAGPTARPPAPAAPAGPPPGPRGVPLHVESDQPDVQLLVRTGQMEAEGWGYRGVVTMAARDYSLICTAPCDAQVPPGPHRLALTEHGGRVVEADDPIEVMGPSTLRAHYESRMGIRVTGYVIGVATLVTGVVLIATSYNGNCNPAASNCQQFNTGQLVGGIVTIIAGGIVGGVMASIGDKADLQLVPMGAAGPIKLPGSNETVAVGASESAGLALRLSF
jgi:hypothetical protein